VFNEECGQKHGCKGANTNPSAKGGIKASLWQPKAFRLPIAW